MQNQILKIEQHLSESDRALDTKEISEFLGTTESTAFNILVLMEAFEIVEKVKRGRNYFYLKGVYDDEQISKMLPPEKVIPPPRIRRYLPRIRRRKPNPLEEHLSDLSMRASSGEGISSLAIIGLTEEDTVEEIVLADEVTIEVEEDLVVEERRVETPITVKPFGTVGHLSKDLRRLTTSQRNYLKDQLNWLDGYEEMDIYNTFFAKFRALEHGKYGNVFYCSLGSNSWDHIHQVTVDPSISDSIVLPLVEMNRWASWNDFLTVLEKTGRQYSKSQYDMILDDFMESGHRLVELTVENRKAVYVKRVLKMRIDERGLGDKVEASHVQDWVYLEKVDLN